MSKVEGDVSNLSEGKISELLDLLGANILEVQEHHGAIVIKSYFKGGAPFKKVKNKEDFPDAFILDIIKIHMYSRRPFDGVLADCIIHSKSPSLDRVSLDTNDG